MFMSDCAERHHVHVEGNEGEAKLWLSPVSVADAVGYSPRQINRIKRIVQDDRVALILAIDAICGRNIP